jgi:hypothetical protein
MAIIDDSSRFMASESLRDDIDIADVDITAFQDRFIITILHIKVGSKIETIVGTMVSYLIGVDHEIEITVMMNDAFSLTDAWPNINIEKYELHMGENIVTMQGPFKTSAFGVKNIDVERRTCVLAMKLCKR